MEGQQPRTARGTETRALSTCVCPRGGGGAAYHTTRPFTACCRAASMPAGPARPAEAVSTRLASVGRAVPCTAHPHRQARTPLVQAGPAARHTDAHTMHTYLADVKDVQGPVRAADRDLATFAVPSDAVERVAFPDGNASDWPLPTSHPPAQGGSGGWLAAPGTTQTGALSLDRTYLYIRVQVPDGQLTLPIHGREDGRVHGGPAGIQDIVGESVERVQRRVFGADRATLCSGLSETNGAAQRCRARQAVPSGAPDRAPCARADRRGRSPSS